MPWDDDIDWYPTGGDENVDVGSIWDKPSYGNPYLPYGEGGDADSPARGAFDQAGSGGAQFDWGGSAMSWLEKILKASGLTTTNKDGSLNLGSLLGILMAGGGAINANSSSKEARALLESGANKSNEFAQGQYDKAQGRLTPFIDSGLGALAQLSAGTPTLADKFVSQGSDRIWRRSSVGGPCRN